MEVLNVKVVIFVVAGNYYAIELDYLTEIITEQRLQKVDSLDNSSVEGIFSIRDSLYTCVNLRRFLNLSGDTSDSKRLVVLTHYNGHLVSFTIDSVVGLVSIDKDSVTDTKEVIAMYKTSLSGAFSYKDKLVVMLDIPAIYNSLE
jgi:chemotaxis signal transduction protein